MPVLTYESTRRRKPEEQDRHLHSRKNVRSHLMLSRINRMWTCELDLTGSGLDPVAVSREHGNESSGSKEGKKLLDQLGDCKLLMKGSASSRIAQRWWPASSNGPHREGKFLPEGWGRNWLRNVQHLRILMKRFSFINNKGQCPNKVL
jgi:hypothetical protein